MNYNVFFFQEGDKLPSADLFEDSPANKVNIAELCAGKKVVIFAVPGAFTPGCSKVNYFFLFIQSLIINSVQCNVCSVC